MKKPNKIITCNWYHLLRNKIDKELITDNAKDKANEEKTQCVIEIEEVAEKT